MKKTFTLLATVVLLSSVAFAQYNNNRPNDDNYNNNYREVVIDNRYDDHGRYDHHFGDNKKDMQIDRINYSYDRKIEWVQNSFFMGRHKKQYKIAQLQAQRDYEIGCVVAKFNGGNNHYSRNDNHYNHDDRRNW